MQSSPSKMSLGNMKRLALVLTAALLFPLPALAEDQAPPAQYQNLLTPLLESGTDVLGAPLVYPDGDPNVTAAIVIIPPGGETGWHSHEVPLFAYILEGELTVDYGEKGKKTYRAGDGVLEAMDWPHNGTNTADVPMKLIAVYMGGGDKANTLREPLP
jgi:quercetin dioxygenase-like cupin family protein